MAFCNKCGTKLGKVYKFCPKCGEPLNQEMLAAAFEKEAQRGMASEENAKENISWEEIPEPSVGLQEEHTTWEEIPDDSIREAEPEQIAWDESRQQALRDDAEDDFSWDEPPQKSSWDDELDSDYSQRRAPSKKKKKKNTTALVLMIVAIVVGVLAIGGVVLFMMRDRLSGIPGLSNLFGTTKTLDLFEDVTVDFSGTNGNGTAIVMQNPGSEYTGKITYILDKTSGLSNGEQITMYAAISSEVDAAEGSRIAINIDELKKYCRDEFGAQPEETQKTVTVTGLTSGITSLYQLTEEPLNSMKTVLSDRILQQSFNLTEASVTGSEYLGGYILTATNSGSDVQNKVYLVSRADVQFTNGDYFSYYYYTLYNNVTRSDDGTVVLDANMYAEPGDTQDLETVFGTLTYTGYPDLNSLYNTVIAPDLTGFTVVSEVNDHPMPSSIQSTEEPEEEQEPDEPDEPEQQTTDTDETQTNTTPNNAASYWGGHATSDGQIFPDSSSRELGADEVNALSPEAAQDAINEIYARHGGIFIKYPDINTYYQQFSWYSGTRKVTDIGSADFNDFERVNITKLTEVARNASFNQ